ncbi:MAG TPA: DUF4397 domain-containing protein [Puia sp.]|uniref:DUF4397 domain-containing protein n=1 Tax=Puia sp. TaxID=2045100 RepID=UPI002C3A6F6C|nr:DUF4397 domain-containing protein [Puia sp.]HVU94347.1 DUF4397 domain-containing protein [Puia sp.]
MKKGLPGRWPAVLLAAALFSCTKTTPLSGSASLTIVNAVAGSNPLTTNFSKEPAVDWYTKLSFGTFQEFSCPGGTTSLALYQAPDTLAKSAPLYSLDLELPVNTIHSLFLTGTTSHPDTLFTIDTPPFHAPADSSMGVRFVNLSPGSAPVSVDILGQANGSEVGSLSYKSLSAFRNYAATAAVSAYTFEFRDAASGTLLASYVLPPSPYRNYTIAFEGLPGPGAGATPQGSYLINNY